MPGIDLAIKRALLPTCDAALWQLSRASQTVGETNRVATPRLIVFAYRLRREPHNNRRNTPNEPTYCS
jgi:hypothetical protein